MSADIQKRAAEAVELLLAAGADDAWATMSLSRDVEFSYRDGALEKVQDTTSRQLAVQVYANDRYSSHQTTDLNPERLNGFLEQAVAITAALEPDPQRSLAQQELFADRPDTDLDLVDGKVQALDRDQRLAWCVALDDAARGNERVISATSGVYDGTQTTASASSNGFSGTQESTYCWLGTNITLMDRGDRRASDSFFAGSPHVDGVPEAGSIASTALERALARLDAEKGPTVKTTMVVDSRAAAQLIGRLMRPANARSVQQQRSFWASILGEQAFSGITSLRPGGHLSKDAADRRRGHRKQHLC
jgi:PmbA protein